MTSDLGYCTGYDLEIELLGFVPDACLLQENTSYCYLSGCYTVPSCFPWRGDESSPVLGSIAITRVLPVSFYFSEFNRFVFLCHSGFNLHFPTD